ncbi:hypothetical protein CPLU01_07163 [Colletotrichum plurivorum]|uniref:Uncharacterized protein n=1 Tax=Colletotrichum plurivorum TaxID=2175906 RepID=A0A8H6KGL3_9PEZI|nr:hypothetical protein CPLU01_07163 [Colletotrichum plurivorum]
MAGDGPVRGEKDGAELDTPSVHLEVPPLRDTYQKRWGLQAAGPIRSLGGTPTSSPVRTEARSPLSSVLLSSMSRLTCSHLHACWTTTSISTNSRPSPGHSCTPLPLLQPSHDSWAPLWYYWRAQDTTGLARSSAASRTAGLGLKQEVPDRVLVRSGGPLGPLYASHPWTLEDGPWTLSSKVPPAPSSSSSNMSSSSSENWSWPSAVASRHPDSSAAQYGRLSPVVPGITHHPFIRLTRPRLRSIRSRTARTHDRRERLAPRHSSVLCDDADRPRTDVGRPLPTTTIAVLISDRDSAYMCSTMPVDGVPHADWPSRAAVQRRRRVSHATVDGARCSGRERDLRRPRPSGKGKRSARTALDRLSAGNSICTSHQRHIGPAAALQLASVPPRVPTPAGSSTVLLKSSLAPFEGPEPPRRLSPVVCGLPSPVPAAAPGGVDTPDGGWHLVRASSETPDQTSPEPRAPAIIRPDKLVCRLLAILDQGPRASSPRVSSLQSPLQIDEATIGIGSVRPHPQRNPRSQPLPLARRRRAAAGEAT